MFWGEEPFGRDRSGDARGLVGGMGNHGSESATGGTLIALIGEMWQCSPIFPTPSDSRIRSMMMGELQLTTWARACGCTLN